MTDMRLEVDIIPVSDIERSKAFYGRLGWRLRPDLELALSLRDLLSAGHVELGATESGDLPSRVEPSASLSLTWTW